MLLAEKKFASNRDLATISQQLTRVTNLYYNDRLATMGHMLMFHSVTLRLSTPSSVNWLFSEALLEVTSQTQYSNLTATAAQTYHSPATDLSAQLWV